MAPEQILLQPVDARADLYALGVIYFQLLTGKVPFEASSSVQIMMATVNQPVPAMAERSPGVEVPAPLERLVRRLLEKKAEDRPSSSDDLLRELREVQRQLGWISAEDSGSHSGARPAAIARAVAAAKDADATSAMRPTPPPQKGLPSATLKSWERTPGPAAPTPPVAPAEPPRARAPMIAGVAIGVALALAAAFFLLPRLFPTPPPVAPPPVEPPPVVVPPPPVVVAPPPPAPPFVLVLESLPAGAEVFVGEVRLGTTPLQLSIDPASVERAPRSFALRLAGHAPYSIVQGPSSSSVRIVAPLVAEAAPIRPKTPPKRPKPGGGDPDIRLER